MRNYKYYVNYKTLSSFFFTEYGFISKHDVLINFHIINIQFNLHLQRKFIINAYKNYFVYKKRTMNLIVQNKRL